MDLRHPVRDLPTPGFALAYFAITTQAWSLEFKYLPRTSMLTAELFYPRRMTLLSILVVLSSLGDPGVGHVVRLRSLIVHEK